jgi:Uma2 family endonuclease
MSPVTKFSDLDLNKVYTYADYLTWQFDERVELIKGFIRKMSPAPSRKHQVVSSNLHGHFFATFKNHSCNLFHAPFDVRLPVATKKKNSTVVQPDICIIRDKNKLDDKGCNGSPDLIVEIISVNNSKHDVDTKFRFYEEAGVKEYWIVFPEEKFVNLYYLENNKFIGMKPFTEGETLQSKAFENLKINVVDVFENID